MRWPSGGEAIKTNGPLCSLSLPIAVRAPIVVNRCLPSDRSAQLAARPAMVAHG
jgi:hypothetical protein